MSILWCGGEDLDLPRGSGVLNISGTSRSGYVRASASVTPSSGYRQSLPFSGGAVTSCWFTFRPRANVVNMSRLLFGLTRSGAAAGSGLYFGSSSSSASKASLWKYDGSTATELATEAGTAFASCSGRKFDVQITSFGASGTVNFYADGGASPFLTYTGNLAWGSVTDLDSVILGAQPTNPSTLSEFIVADQDTRLMVLATLPPTYAGDGTAWTGTPAAIDEEAIDDADLVYSNTVSQDFQTRPAALPSGAFIIKAIKIAARAARDSSATPTKLGIGTQVAKRPIGGTGDGSVDTTKSVAAGRKYLHKVTATESASAVALRIGWLVIHTSKIIGLIYADSAGAPGALLAQTDEVVGAAATGPIDYSFAAPFSVVAGTSYWIGLITEQGVNSGILADSTVSDLYNLDTYSDGPSDPAGSMSASASTPWTPLVKATGEAVQMDAGQTAGTTFDTYERLLQTNPATGANWQRADFADLQMTLRAIA